MKHRARRDHVERLALKLSAVSWAVWFVGCVIYYAGHPLVRNEFGGPSEFIPLRTHIDLNGLFYALFNSVVHLVVWRLLVERRRAIYPPP